MGTNQSLKLRKMAIKVEGTPGTYDAPATGENIIRFRNVDIQPNIEFDDDAAKYVNGSHAEDESIAGVQSATVTASVRVTYGGAAATVPNWYQAAYACGCGGIGWDGGSEVAIGSAVEGIALVGRAAYDDITYSILVIETEVGASPVYTHYRIAGAMGNMVLTCEGPGKPIMANFTFTGKLTDIVDAADVAMGTTQTALAESYLSSASTIGGTAEKIGTWAFDMGNTITPLYDQSDATGIRYFHITERHPRFTCNPLAVKQATTDWLNVVLTESTPAIVVPTTNTQLTIIDGQPQNFGISSREGLVALDHTFRALQNGTPGSLTDAALDLEDTFEFLQGARS